MDTPEKKPKTPKQETELEDKSKKRSEEIARMIHPHDDEPDPTATWAITISRRCYLHSA